jgi:hypothetical protein
MVTEARRVGLLRQYFFLCACPSCTGDRRSDHRMVGFACARSGCDGAVSPPPGAPSTDAEVPGELLVDAAQVEKMRLPEDAAWRRRGCCDECATPLDDPQAAVERASRAHELLQVRTPPASSGCVHVKGSCEIQYSPARLSARLSFLLRRELRCCREVGLLTACKGALRRRGAVGCLRHAR